MKKLVLKLTLILLGTFVTTSVLAEDLWQVYLQACANDPAYKAARATYLATRENLPISRAALLPNVALSASTDRQQIDSIFPGRNVSPSVDGSYYNTENQYGLNISQPIFNYALWAGLKGANATVKQAEATYLAAQQDLMLRVAQAYFAVLQAKDTVTNLEAQRLAVGRQLAQAKQQFEVGTIAITNVYEAQASYDAVVANEIAAQNTLANTLQELKAITDAHYATLVGAGHRLPLLMPQPTNLSQWLQIAEQQNYSLAAARYAGEVAQQNIKVQFAGHFPTVNANAGYNILDNSNQGNGQLSRSKSGNIGLSVALPVYQGGLVNAQTRQASYQYQQAIAQLEFTHRTVQTQTSEAYLGIVSNISKIKADQQAVVSSASSLEATEAAYSVGTRTIVDVLDAQSNLYQARNAYSQDRYNYLVNILSLKQAAGTLSPADIQQMNAWLSNQVKVTPTVGINVEQAGVYPNVSAPKHTTTAHPAKPSKKQARKTHSKQRKAVKANHK